MKRKMTRERFVEWTHSRGWKSDRYGRCLLKEEGGKSYRFKLSRIAVRLEVHIPAQATTFGRRPPYWSRLKSGYFSNLSLTPDGDIAGLTR